MRISSLEQSSFMFVNSDSKIEDKGESIFYYFYDFQGDNLFKIHINLNFDGKLNSITRYRDS